MHKNKYHTILIIFLLTFLTLIVFFPVCGFEFVDRDDDVNVKNNPYLNQVSISNMLVFWQKPYEYLYIPSTYTFWAFIARVSQVFSTKGINAFLSPYYFHTANLCIHIVNVWLVFTILRLLLKVGYRDNYIQNSNNSKTINRENWAAGAGALLFALHPVQVEPVSWITGMKDLLFTCFSLLSIWQYLVFAKLSSGRFESSKVHIRNVILNPKAVHYVIAFAAFVLALLSKPTAVVVPVIAGILDYFILKRTLKKIAIALAFWIFIDINWVVLSIMVQPGEAVLSFIPSVWLRPFIAGDALAFYLYKIIFPIWLGVYAYLRQPEYMLQHGLIYFTWLIPVGVALLTLFAKNRRLFFASYGVFIAGVLPVLGLIPFGAQYLSTVSDRYIYLSMLGPAIALSWFFLHNRKQTVALVIFLILGLFGIRSSFQIQHWRNGETLFEHAVEVNPNSYVAYKYLGLISAGKGNFEEAISNYSKAIQIKPDYAEAHNNLGVALERQGQLNKAIMHYTRALEIKPNFAPAYNGIGVSLAKKGKYKEAITQFLKALKINPNAELVHYNLGKLLFNQGNTEEAFIHYRKAIRIKPNYSQAYYSFGFALEHQEKYKEAIFQYSRAIEINPDFERARKRMKFLLQNGGRTRFEDKP